MSLNDEKDNSILSGEYNTGNDSHTKQETGIIKGIGESEASVNIMNSASEVFNESMQQPLESAYYSRQAYTPIKEIHPMLEEKKKDFAYFGPLSIIYALVFTFCTYKVESSILSPIYAIASCLYVFLGIKSLGVAIKNNLYVYMGGVVLLGINLATTADGVLIVFDNIGIVLLLISGALHSLYDDKKWDFGKYLASILTLFFGQIEWIFAFFTDMGGYYSESKGKPGKGKYVALGVIIAIPMLIIVLLLLGSADLVFGEMLDNITKNFRLSTDWFGVIVMFILALLLSYGFISACAAHIVSPEENEKKNYNSIVAITINAMLSVVYVIFSAIQILYLFIGNMELPGDYTYAEYAREGFFQLLFVCMINMILVLICLKLFDNNKVLKIFLMIISACTFIMIASSLFRMIMYVEVYQLSYLRYMVLFGLIVITVLMLGICITIFKSDFPLFRYCTLAVTILYLCFAFSKPAYQIAKYNLSDRYDEAHIDYTYINSYLCADATPAIVDAIERRGSTEETVTKFTEYFEKYYKEDYEGFRHINFSYNRYFKAVDMYSHYLKLDAESDKANDYI